MTQSARARAPTYGKAPRNSYSHENTAPPSKTKSSERPSTRAISIGIIRARKRARRAYPSPGVGSTYTYPHTRSRERERKETKRGKIKRGALSGGQVYVYLRERTVGLVERLVHACVERCVYVCISANARLAEWKTGFIFLWGIRACVYISVCASAIHILSFYCARYTYERALRFLSSLSGSTTRRVL